MMTPKEKAEKLFERHHYQICNDNGLAENDSTEYCAKQCVLIAVEEIIKEYNNEVLESNDVDRIIYWQEVKKEIENL